MITQCLKAWRDGNSGALERLTDAVYSELRRLAGAVMGSSGPQTIQPTELVHELYFRLPGVREIDWDSRTQFLNVAARMMRNILVDHARRRSAAKRSGGAVRETRDFAEARSGPISILAVHDALERLAVRYPRQSKVVELRFFGGLSAEETADVLKQSGEECSLRTVERDWTFAKAWLQRVMGAE